MGFGNYSLVANTQYKGRSLEEMLKPYALYTQEYRAQEDAIAELATKADVWQGLANEQTDPIAYAQYTNYANALKDQAALMADRGLTPSSRQAMLNLKRRYASEIMPIEEAYKLRKTLADEQRKARLTDNSLMFDKDYSTASLDELLNNPNASYQTISGNELTKKSAAMAGALAKTIQQHPEYNEILNGQYIESMQQSGYTPDQIINTIINDPNAPEELKQIVNTVYEESGLNNFDAESQRRGRQYINLGIYDAIGTQKYDMLSNKNYISDLERERLKLKESESGVITGQDGTTYTKLSGGNTLIEKDGKSVVISSSGSPILGDPSILLDKTTTSSDSIEEMNNFTPFFMNGWGDSSTMSITTVSNGYSTEGWGKNEVWQEGVTKAGENITGADGIERKTFMLGDNAKAQIKKELQTYNLANNTKFTLHDIVVLRDQDALSGNHYKIILKGMKENGEVVQDKDGNIDLNYWGIQKRADSLTEIPGLD